MPDGQETNGYEAQRAGELGREECTAWRADRRGTLRVGGGAGDGRRYSAGGTDDGGALCRAAGCGCVRVDLRLYGEGAEGAVGRSRQWVYGGLRADGESALSGTDQNATAVARRGGGSGFACDALPTATEKTEVSQKMKALRHELAK